MDPSESDPVPTSLDQPVKGSDRPRDDSLDQAPGASDRQESLDQPLSSGSDQRKTSLDQSRGGDSDRLSEGDRKEKRGESLDSVDPEREDNEPGINPEELEYASDEDNLDDGKEGDEMVERVMTIPSVQMTRVTNGKRFSINR